MWRKIFSSVMLAPLIISTLTLGLRIQLVWAEGTIYIRADGSVDPATAPIFTIDNVTYTFTDDVINDSIVVVRDNIVIDGTGHTVQGPGANPSRGIDLSGRTNVTVKNAQIENFTCGIWLSSSSNNGIAGNNIADNGRGVWLYSSSNNTIYGNNITANNGAGILLDSSSNSSICGNNIADDGVGISLHFSSNNSISGNNIADGIDGVCLSSSSNNTMTGNNVTANDDVGICLIFSSNNNGIYRNNITANSYVGLFLYSSSSNSICVNNVADGGDGVCLSSSSNNVMTGNNIKTNNGYGIYLLSSSNNSVYHNNFLINTSQVFSYQSTNVWDYGYPSGGNYWSDYAGVDVRCGPDQSQPGSDCIGDTPYVIDSKNLDNYPLMNPWVPPSGHDVSIISIVSFKTVIGQGFNGDITVYGVNKGEYSETFNVTAYANMTPVNSTSMSLNSSSTLTIAFTWNTSGLSMGNYTMSAYAWPVSGEINTADNNSTGGMVYVGVPGDLNGDGIVDKLDATTLENAFFATPGSSNWNPNAGINSDGTVDIYDAVLLAKHFGQHYP